MKIADLILPEFDNEMEITRKTLERVPDDKFDWKPHEKSMTLGRLAGHVAEIPGWAATGIKTESLDFAPPGGEPMAPTVVKSRQDVLDLFDKNAKEARAAIAGVSDEELQKNWSLLNGGKTLMTMPKLSVVRGFAMNHLIHHRAQLGVYLRLNDLPVPSVYGPSADEGQMF